MAYMREIPRFVKELNGSGYGERIPISMRFVTNWVLLSTLTGPAPWTHAPHET
jgi:hypothetical protein